MGDNNGTSIIVAAAILGLSVLVGAFMLGRSVDGAAEQLAAMEVAIGKVATTSVANAPAAAPAPRRGPDPNKVYSVNIAGAPIKGPETAKVTIVEFSDFQ